MKCIVAIAIVVVAGLSHAAFGANPADFEVFNYDLYDNGSVDLNGRLFVPNSYDPNQSYPLVVFMHGLGEVGTNNTSQVNGNINNLLAAAKNRDFFLYAPQTGGGWSAATVDRVANMVGKATQDYSVDTSKLYVTGLSLGGGGTWETITRYTDAFAAAVPICGVSGYTNRADTLVGKPIWAYHAKNDGTVNVSATRGMVNAIRAADGGKPSLSFPLDNTTSNPYHSNGSPYYSDSSTYYQENELRYSEYESGGHGVWGRAYNEQPMYDWLLVKTNPQHELQPGETVLIDLGASTITSADSLGRVWNCTPYGVDRTTGPSLSFCKTSAGQGTGIIVGLSDTFGNGASTNGITAGSKYDTNIAKDSWYTGSWTNNDLAQSERGVIDIEGLTPNGKYQVSLFASHTDDDGGRGRVTRYTIGSDHRDLDIVGNTTNSAVFDSIYADENGELQIVVTAADGTETRFGFIGAIELTALQPIPEPATLLLLGSGAMALLRRRRV